LAGYSNKELMSRGLEKTPMGRGRKLVEFTEKSGADWTVESTPVFLITQDQSAIILENAISIVTSGAKSDPVYQKPVRVVSQPKRGTDLVAYWTADGGKNLKEESAALFAESIEIALNDASNVASSNSNAHKTFRYLEGGTEKIERGQLITTYCDHMLIKTLRGEPMSIPNRQYAPEYACH
jgi:hypothetical protein